MKKADRLTAFVEQLAPPAEPGLDPCYTGYFVCFNDGRYYEAHDVLEHLWLQNRSEPFFKGLIQFAGGFVHLQKQFLRPLHAKDGRRLRPAVRLFQLALANLRPFCPAHMQLDVEAVCRLGENIVREIEASGFQRNPWHPEAAPQLTLERQETGKVFATPGTDSAHPPATAL